MFLVWIAGLAALTLVFSRPQDAPVEATAPPAPVSVAAPAVLENFDAGVTLERAADSHFYADVQVNGTPVRFVVDTGASSVVLTPEDARRLGVGDGGVSVGAIRPGGTVRLKPVTLDRVALETLSADHVPAMVAEEPLPVSLLGQSWLARLESVTIEGDRMVLR